jgi:hypothetical protein
LIKQNKALVDYFQNEIELFSDKLKNMKHTKNQNHTSVDTVFREIIERAWAK